MLVRMSLDRNLENGSMNSSMLLFTQCPRKCLFNKP
jgi:hypothetical protein